METFPGGVSKDRTPPSTSQGQLCSCLSADPGRLPEGVKGSRLYARGEAAQSCFSWGDHSLKENIFPDPLLPFLYRLPGGYTQVGTAEHRGQEQGHKIWNLFKNALYLLFQAESKSFSLVTKVCTFNILYNIFIIFI